MMPPMSASGTPKRSRSSERGLDGGRLRERPEQLVVLAPLSASL